MCSVIFTSGRGDLIRDKRLELLNVLKFTISQDLESNIFDCRLSRGDRGQLDWGRRKIRLIEGNAQCRHLKKFTCKWTLLQVFICLRKRGETVEPERRLDWQQFTKLGQKYEYD
jgi:hypothetical protein